MSTRTLRTLLFVAALVASAVTLLAFLAAPEAGSAYVRLIGPVGTDLPVPTLRFSLPMLRTATGGPHGEPVTPPGAAVLWLLLFAGPWLRLAWALRAPDAAGAAIRWVGTGAVFVPLVVGVAALVLLGLVLPFTCL